MSLALRAEWTKLRTVASTGWLLLGVVLVTVAVSAAADAADVCTSSAGCHPDTTRLSLTGTDVGQAVVAIVAVLAVTAEYGTGNPPPTHAWFIGFRGTVAFAVIVEGGGFGAAVAAPIASQFLTALGPA